VARLGFKWSLRLHLQGRSGAFAPRILPLLPAWLFLRPWGQGSRSKQNGPLLFCSAALLPCFGLQTNQHATVDLGNLETALIFWSKYTTA